METNEGTILFCNGGCYQEHRDRCPNAAGINRDCLDVREDRLDEDGFVVANIYCYDIRNDDFFEMHEESNYAK